MLLLLDLLGIFKYDDIIRKKGWKQLSDFRLQTHSKLFILTQLIKNRAEL